MQICFIENTLPHLLLLFIIIIIYCKWDSTTAEEQNIKYMHL